MVSHFGAIQAKLIITHHGNIGHGLRHLPVHLEAFAEQGRHGAGVVGGVVVCAKPAALPILVTQPGCEVGRCAFGFSAVVIPHSHPPLIFCGGLEWWPFIRVPARARGFDFTGIPHHSLFIFRSRQGHTNAIGGLSRIRFVAFPLPGKLHLRLQNADRIWNMAQGQAQDL